MILLHKSLIILVILSLKVTFIPIYHNEIRVEHGFVISRQIQYSTQNIS